MAAEQSTSERLLDAGEKLFSENDFAATSVRDLATEADVNIAAINYHFQSKENLYLAVLLRALRSKCRVIVEAVNRLVAESGDDLELEELVRVFVGSHIRDALTNPRGRCLFGLLAREMITNQVSAEVFMKELARPVFASFGKALLQTRPGLNPEDVGWIQFNIVGQIVHFVMKWERVARPVTDSVPERMLFAGMPFDSVETFIEKVVNHVTVFSVGGVDAMLAAKTNE